MKCVRESKLLTISRSRTAEPYHYTEEKKKKSIPVSYPKNFAFRNGEQSKTLGRVKRHQLPTPKKTQSDSTLAEKSKKSRPCRRSQRESTFLAEPEGKCPSNHTGQSRNTRGSSGSPPRRPMKQRRRRRWKMIRDETWWERFLKTPQPMSDL